MAVWPHYSITEYLDSLNLQGTEKVNLYLAAEFQSLRDYPLPGWLYNFSLAIETRDQTNSPLTFPANSPVFPAHFPLAQVYAVRERVNLKGGPWQVQDLQDILEAEKWYPSGRLLEPFMYKHIPCRLEPGMSPESVLYVFSGFVDFALETYALLDLFSSSLTLIGREVDSDFLALLHSRTAGIFQGYRHLNQEDLDLLWLAEGSRAIL